MQFRKNVEFHRSWIADQLYMSPDDLEGEEWLQFNSYQGQTFKDNYCISNKGRVRRKNDNSIVRGDISFDGYHEIALSGANGSIRIHRAVLQIFGGPPPEGMKSPTVHHINHDKLDNRIENLQWMSAFENNQEGHGTRCKIEDADGEHIFPSQKVASAYIGRHEDYISEGIKSNYKLTKEDGTSFDVYTEVDGEWVKYHRKMPNNRRWCRVVRDSEVQDFDSFQQCSRFFNKDPHHVSTCIHQNWPLDLPEGCDFYVYDRDIEDYKIYVPVNKKAKQFQTACSVSDTTGTYTFPSITKAAQYIGRDSEYLRIALKEHKVVKDCRGNVVVAAIIS